MKDATGQLIHFITTPGPKSYMIPGNYYLDSIEGGTDANGVEVKTITLTRYKEIEITNPRKRKKIRKIRK